MTGRAKVARADEVARREAVVDRRYHLALLSAVAGFPLAWASSALLAPLAPELGWLPYAAWFLSTGLCSVRLTRASEAYRECVVRARMRPEPGDGAAA